MKGKLIGFNVFEGKKEGSGLWCNCYFSMDMPEGGKGIRVEKFMCRPDVLPTLGDSIINKDFILSTRNNFLSEVYLLDK